MYTKRSQGYCKSTVIVSFFGVCFLIVLVLILLMIRLMYILHFVFIKCMYSHALGRVILAYSALEIRQQQQQQKRLLILLLLTMWP